MGRSRPSTPHTVGTSISHRGLSTRLTPRPRLGSRGRGSRGRPGHVAARKHIGCRLRLGDSGSRGSRARASEPSGSGFESRFGHFEPTVDKCVFATQTSCRRALGGRARSGEEASAGGPQQGERFLSGPLRVDRRRRPRQRALIRIEGDDAFKALSSSPIRKVPF